MGCNCWQIWKKWLAPCLRIWLFSGLDLAPWQKVVLATLVCCFVLLCWVVYMCVVQANIVYFMGAQLVFDWERLENFLMTHDRPVGH